MSGRDERLRRSSVNPHGDLGRRARYEQSRRAGRCHDDLGEEGTQALKDERCDGQPQPTALGPLALRLVAEQHNREDGRGDSECRGQRHLLIEDRCGEHRGQCR